MWDVCAYILLYYTKEEPSFRYVYVLDFTFYVQERNRIKCTISAKKTGSEVAMRQRSGMHVSANKFSAQRTTDSVDPFAGVYEALISACSSAEEGAGQSQVHKLLIICSLFPSPITLFKAPTLAWYVLSG